MRRTKIKIWKQTLIWRGKKKSEFHHPVFKAETAADKSNADIPADGWSLRRLAEAQVT